MSHTEPYVHLLDYQYILACFYQRDIPILVGFNVLVGSGNLAARSVAVLAWVKLYVSKGTIEG